MGCFDQTQDDGKGIADGGGVPTNEGKGRGGFTTLGNIYEGLFRSRRFNDTSLQSHVEAPDPLFRLPKRSASFAITARRGNSGGV